MHNKKNLGCSAGISLVELLLSLTIIGILLTLVSPNSSEMQTRAKVDKTAKNLQSAIEFGQTYARHLSIPSALCAGTPADSCNSTNWSKGWTLFRTNPQNPSLPLEVVRFYEQNTNGLKVNLFNLLDNTRIIFSGEGFTETTLNQVPRALVCAQNLSYSAMVEIQRANTTITTNHLASDESETC